MNIGDHITLPEINAPVEKHKIGSIFHQIRSAIRTSVVSKEQVRYFGTRVDRLYTLDNEEKILVVDRVIKQGFSDFEADGVLYMKNGKRGWLYHRLLNDYLSWSDTKAEIAYRDHIAENWTHRFQFKQELIDDNGNVIAEGLRPPQIGALHAIGAHWSISSQHATIIMPTGTGKTETMLAALVNYIKGCVLVVVPSQALRNQISSKFISLGLLRKLGNLPYLIPSPKVGVLKRRPIDESDLEIFNACNVVVATIGTVAQGTAARFVKHIANKCSVLILDEAHHVAAESWTLLRDSFRDKPTLQFTATPFRRDGKAVDGKIIYSYPLGKAQRDGYFKPITFKPVFDLRTDEMDKTIAEAALAQLINDLENDYDHIIMARCSSINRATEVFKIYRTIGARFNPILVHSESGDNKNLLDQIDKRESRIVVCVDMLGEGFDLPYLKIAALHDIHKSLAVLLQFIGRFTRSAGERLGDATLIANIANQQVSESLERLYSEDADWNDLISEYASAAVKEHAAMIEFLENSKRVFVSDESDEVESLSPKMLHPKFSTAIFKSEHFSPKKFYEALKNELAIRGVWLNEKDSTMYFVTESSIKVNWSRSKSTYDHQWDLYVLYYNSDLKLLFIHSSDKDSLHQELANAVSNNEATLQMGDSVFRSLVGISRLVFQNIGLKKPGRRNLRYSMYTGADVAQALSPAQKATSTKSNVYGGGYENGKPVSIGCSYKGRIWSKEQGPIYRFTAWCDEVGRKVNDASINTDEIIDNVIIPEIVQEIPAKEILTIDWPVELFQRPEDSITIISSHGEVPFCNYSIEYLETDREKNQILFSVKYDEKSTKYALIIRGEAGYGIEHIEGEAIGIRVGKLENSLSEWFAQYPPSILFVDSSELEGNLLIEPKQRSDDHFPPANIIAWDWHGVNITKESQWKDNAVRTDSIQFKVINDFSQKGFHVVFDDDDSGEASDVICISEDTNNINVILIHCKFSGGERPGQRVKDVMEVCGQAARSVKWAWKFTDLCKHILSRENQRNRRGRATRFAKGALKDIAYYSKLSKFKTVKFEVFVVQPGVSKSSLTEDQINIFASAHSYILEISGVELKVICSE